MPLLIYTYTKKVENYFKFLKKIYLPYVKNDDDGGGDDEWSVSVSFMANQTKHAILLFTTCSKLGVILESK